jgi:hypothetical protein
MLPTVAAENGTLGGGGWHTAGWRGGVLEEAAPALPRFIEMRSPIMTVVDSRGERNDDRR